MSPTTAPVTARDELSSYQQHRVQDRARWACPMPKGGGGPKPMAPLTPFFLSWRLKWSNAATISGCGEVTQAPGRRGRHDLHDQREPSEKPGVACSRAGTGGPSGRTSRAFQPVNAGALPAPLSHSVFPLKAPKAPMAAHGFPMAANVDAPPVGQGRYASAGTVRRIPGISGGREEGGGEERGPQRRPSLRAGHKIGRHRSYLEEVQFRGPHPKSGRCVLFFVGWRSRGLGGSSSASTPLSLLELFPSVSHPPTRFAVRILRFSSLSQTQKQQTGFFPRPLVCLIFLRRQQREGESNSPPSTAIHRHPQPVALYLPYTRSRTAFRASSLRSSSPLRLFPVSRRGRSARLLFYNRVGRNWSY